MSADDAMKADALSARIGSLSPEKQALLAKKLAARLTARGGAGNSRDAIRPREQAGPAPLSHAQELLWLYEQMRPGTDAYNLAMARRVRGPLDLAALARAFEMLVARHESLRTMFVEVDGVPKQLVGVSGAVEIESHDLRAMPAATREAEGVRRLQNAVCRPFDLRRGTFPRVVVVRLADDEALLLVVVHHIVFDGGSISVLFAELSQAYDATVNNTAPAFAALPIQLADYATWERRELDDARIAPALDFWRQYLHGAPSGIDLPTDFTRSSSTTGPGARFAITLPVATRDVVRALATSNEVTPFMVLLAALQSLLYRYSGQDDLVVGTAVAGRARPGTERLVGYLANTLPIRARFNDEVTFAGLLREVRQGTVQAFDHQDVAYERLVQELRAGRPANEQALFRVMFAMQDADAVAANLGPATLEPFGVELGAAKFDLTMTATERPDGLRLALEYRTDLFSEPTIAGMLAHFGELLRSACEQPTQFVSRLALLTPSERTKILLLGQGPALSFDECATLASLFEAQVTRTPDAPAIVVGDLILSYREVDERSAALARHLRAIGVMGGVRVAICAERSSKLVVGLLAILRAGGAYIPLDPHYPEERIALILEDADVSVVLTEAALIREMASLRVLARAGGRGSHAPSVVLLDEAVPEAQIALVPPSAADLAYVIYTSGSTGRPKGVAIAHKSVVAFVAWAGATYSSDELAGVIAATSVCFDLSVFEIFVPLLTGGAVILVENALAVTAIHSALPATLINTVPSAISALLRMGGIPASVRTINLAGEPLQQRTVDELYEIPTVRRVYDLYGPSEDTTYSTFMLRQAGGRPSIGLPIANSQAYVLDSERELVPIGVPGELYLGGAGLALGYLNRPDLTAERFVPNPLAEELERAPGDRIYRTGDRVRWTRDGLLEYLGRLDFQVKLRGFRIELGEIETVLRLQPGVGAAVAVVRQDGAAEPRLVAYVAPILNATCPSAAALKGALGTRLPDYMVPMEIVELASIPMTPNGKVDRKALPEPATTASTREFVAPVTAAEIVVATAFAELLRVERVGTSDDFYELGGHSLLAVRIAAMLREQFGSAVSMRLVFEHPKVGNLAAAIDRELGAQRGAGSARILAAPREQFRRRAAEMAEPGALGHVFVFPASFAQARLWFIEALAAGSGNSTYNIPLAWKLSGALDLSALQATLDALRARHESLRTTFSIENDVPVQVVHEPSPLSIAMHDFHGRSGSDARAALRTEANRPFNLKVGPLVRAALFRIAPDEHLFVITVHHITADGLSVATLRRELGEGYAAARAGQLWAPPPPAVQYADYSLWQQEELTGDALVRLEDFWRDRLRGPLPVLDLPMRAPRPAIIGDRPARRCVFDVPASLAARVDALARGEQSSPFMLYLAAFQLLLSRYSGQDDVLVGTPMSGRDGAELEGVVGLLLNTLVLRTDLSGDPTFRVLLGRVRDGTLSAYAHDALPFERVVEVAKPPRNQSITPLFQVMFSMQPMSDPAVDVANADIGGAPNFDGLATQRIAAGLDFTKFDFQLTLVPDGTQYRGAIDYDAGLFADDMMERLATHFVTLLEGIAAAPDRAIGALTLLDDAERMAVVRDWNATDVALPIDTTLQTLIESQARRTPDAVAVRCDNDALSYSDLDARATVLARALVARGVQRGDLVAVCMERSIELVVALLGVLKAGAAYVPVDPELPAERLAFMLSDARCPVVLTQRRVADRSLTSEVFPEWAESAESAESNSGTSRATILCLDTDWSQAAEDATRTRALPVGSPDDLAYMIYTSGSTGRPKGALNRHRGVVNRLLWMQRAFELTTDDRVLQKTPISFDVSVWEFFWPLITGAQLVLAEPGGHRDPAYLSATIREKRITVLHFVPSMLRAFLDNSTSGGATTLRDVMCSGEALAFDLQEKFFARYPGVRLHNLYGPTEAAVDVSVWTCVRDDARHIVPIGRPIDNTQLYVLDTAMEPVPIGVAGELFIGGVQVGAGYHGRPDLTAERFVSDPFAHGQRRSARLYRTGDRARWLSDGTIEYLGRLDFQVKLRGFRIELGEIEAALLAQPAIRECAVILRNDARGEPMLVAYYASATGTETSAADLRAQLRVTLPEHMIPAVFVPVDSLPLSPSGKLDRRALPEPGAYDAHSATAPYRAPETPVEDVLMHIWSEVLGVAKVGTDDNFFDIGGHSLLAMQAASRIARLFSRRVSLRSFFQHATIRTFAAMFVAEEQATGRTNAVARAIQRLREMTPDERARRRAADASRNEQPRDREME